MKTSTTIFTTALAIAIILPAAAALNPGNLPLWFEAGRAAQFTAHAPNSQFNITTAGAEFTLRQAGGQQTTARMTFVGGSLKTQMAGQCQLTAKINRFIGNEPAQWQTGIATFAQVRLEQIYPGVNVVYYGTQEKLEYDFELAAGVDPTIIALRFDGAEKVSVNAAGELVVTLAGGGVTQHPPVAYQTIAGRRTPVTAGYKILDSHTAAFSIGSYDRSQPLVIDPILDFTTYFGGSAGETAFALAVNPSDDSIFIAGQTLSKVITNGVPFAMNGAFTNFGGGTLLGDAFVAHFNSSGDTLLYCTYLGGKSEDAAYALAVDAAGHAFVTGITQSTNFPVSNPVVYGNFNGGKISGKIIPTIKTFPSDCFVTELAADGASLVYSTFLGGNKFESAFGIAVDPAGNAYVTGYTTSTNFPVTAGAYQNRLICPQAAYINQNAFVAEIAAGGGQLNYSTYLGGSNYDRGLGIAYNNGNVIVVGKTRSKNFPWTNGLASSRYLNGRTNQIPVFDGFVTKFTTSGTNLVLQYSTFLGSTNEDVATAVAADAAGNAYVVGWTVSTNFPTVNPIASLSSFIHTNNTSFPFATNAFLSVINYGTNATLAYSQTFGGRGQDVANGVALDSFGNVYVVGSASSTNFPVYTNSIPTAGTNSFSTNSCLRAKNSGASDAFVVGFDSNFSGVFGSAYIGGRGDDFGNAIAVDSANMIVIAGTTTSTNLPVINAAQPKRNGASDTFISKFNFPM